jgi:hypothetical protein
MTTYQFPDAVELRKIEQQKLPRLMAERPIFDVFPIREVNSHLVEWEQQDNYIGLQQVRGLNGAPPKVARIGLKRYAFQPGVYGEFSMIDEIELTRRREMGTFGDQVNIDELVMGEQDRLMLRYLDRIELIGWTLLTTGTFSVSTLLGPILHTDSYTTQTFTAGVAWGTSATATPLADFRQVKLKARGYSVRFDSTAKAFMNSTTANQLYSNNNSTDLFGRRTGGFGTLNSPAQINGLLLGDNLPQIVEYDEGYYDDTGTFQLFIPNNKVIVVGSRPGGTPVAEYLMTRNANNPNSAPGTYTKVVDDENDVPRTVAIHNGHNGGPALYFPSAIVLMTV